MSAHDFVVIRGKPVMHSTATSDYVCGECGGGLVTIFDGEWLTVCSRDRSHGADGFITKKAMTWQRHRQAKQADEARQVFEHLPADVQAILAE